jgi:hypothetical protein
VLRNLIYVFTVVCFLLLPPRFGSGAFLYKNYVIRQYQGRDILCDPYIVEKNDSVIRLFQQRGQIAGQDFPEFLRIFQQFNPHIQDINAIQPGQNILIPLKKLGDDAFPGQSDGVVAIPFMAITQLSDLIQQDAVKYSVKKGDSVSVIISKAFAKLGTKTYDEGVKLFKLINPDVGNINQIQTGQTLNLPNRSLQDQKWYASIFDDEGNLNQNIDLNKILKPSDNLKNRPLIGSSAELEKSGHVSPLSCAAEILNANLLNKGIYYFPKKGTGDFALNLSRHPVMELEGGRRLLFWDTDPLQASDQSALMAYWKELTIVPMPYKTDSKGILEAIFKADKTFDVKNQLHLQNDGVDIAIRANWIITSSFYNENSRLSTHQTCLFLIENESQRIPEPLKRYLTDFNISIKEILKNDSTSLMTLPAADPNSHGKVKPGAVINFNGDLRKFLPDLVKTMGFQYSENINISFPYAGIQIQAFSNLIASKDGKQQVLIDFGDIYGDAVAAIENTGLDIIQIADSSTWENAAKRILDALKISNSGPLNLTAIKDSTDTNIFISFPGLRLDLRENEKVALTSALIHPELIEFLNQLGHQTILIADNAHIDKEGKSGSIVQDQMK